MRCDSQRSQVLHEALGVVGFLRTEGRSATHASRCCASRHGSCVRRFCQHRPNCHRRRHPCAAGVDLIEQLVEIRKGRIDQLSHLPDSVALRNSRLQRHVTEQSTIFLVFAAHNLASPSDTAILAHQRWVFQQPPNFNPAIPLILLVSNTRNLVNLKASEIVTEDSNARSSTAKFPRHLSAELGKPIRIPCHLSIAEDIAAPPQNKATQSSPTNNWQAQRPGCGSAQTPPRPPLILVFLTCHKRGSWCIGPARGERPDVQRVQI